jgi:pimeloyl-ACP methyl ester carboxylesterase
MHLAADVAGFISQHDIASPAPTIIGHSMGAKTALTLALEQPGLFANVIAVDNAPVDAALKSDFGGYVQGMKRVEEAGVKKQSEADEILKDFAKVWDSAFPYQLKVSGHVAVKIMCPSLLDSSADTV